MEYKKVIENWEGFAKDDALWSILNDPNKKNNQWNKTAFFETGKKEIETLFKFLNKNNFIQQRKIALDFGCGVGRLSRALTQYFDAVIGIDASKNMIEHAQQLNKTQVSKLSFLLNESPSLPTIPNNSISFIYSSIVLQHLPIEQAYIFIDSFLKKLEKNGLLVFQVPTKDIRNQSALAKLKSNLKLGERLSNLGLYKKHIMQMNVFSEKRIKTIAAENNAVIKTQLFTNHTMPDFNGNLQFIKKEESVAYESSLFVIKVV